jgi:SAM-dependent methyltransferase
MAGRVAAKFLGAQLVRGRWASSHLPPMDPRAATAAYYDLEPAFPTDIPFYLGQLRSPTDTVLELGCGTGRVSVALAPQASFLQGVDLSPAMIEQCRRRLRDAAIGDKRATVTVGDISDLQLGRRFDLVIAPYRVFQNLTTEAQITGLFATLRAHLASGGRAILNTFRPYDDPPTLVAKWSNSQEDLDWERPVEGGRVTCSVRRSGVSADPLVLYPDLIYRRYRGEVLVEEAVSQIAMRCWYPEELVTRVEREGFAVIQRWGGYAGELYGEGSELIIAFTDA